MRYPKACLAKNRDALNAALERSESPVLGADLARQLRWPGPAVGIVFSSWERWFRRHGWRRTLNRMTGHMLYERRRR